MENKWIEITICGPASSSDEATDALIEAGSSGVLEGDDDGKAARLYGYIDKDNEGSLKDLEKVLEKIDWVLNSNPYHNDDWTEKWKEGLSPIRVTSKGSEKSFLIKAPWHERTPCAGELMVEIEPGMAFGSGSHPTTSLCLKAILEVSAKRELKSVLDVGTGSGILAIAAKRLGVRRVVACDIDPEARSVAMENARLNSVRIGTVAGHMEGFSGTFDMVVCNILKNTLHILKEPLIEKTRPGGFLILSGILREEAAEIKAAFIRSGCEFIKRYSASGEAVGGGHWVALMLKRRI